MFTNTRKLQIVMYTLCVYFSLTISVSAQSPCDGVQMPQGTVCLSQQAANAAAQLAREAPVKDEKIRVLETALVDTNKIITDIKAVAAKNEADLRAALHSTEVQLATKTGQLIGAEANSVRQLAIIDVLLKNVRPKKVGLIVF